MHLSEELNAAFKALGVENPLGDLGEAGLVSLQAQAVDWRDDGELAEVSVQWFGCLAAQLCDAWRIAGSAYVSFISVLRAEYIERSLDEYTFDDVQGAAAYITALARQQSLARRNQWTHDEPVMATIIENDPEAARAVMAYFSNKYTGKKEEK